MKTALLVLVVAAVAFLAGMRVADRNNARQLAAATPSGPLANRAPAQVTGALALPVAPPAPASVKPKSDEATQAVADAIEALISPHASFGQKQALWEQLRKAGRLGEVIAGLKQMAADNPNDPAIPTALGEAEIAELRTVLEGGGDPNVVAIHGLQADQDFNQALGLDPSNWDAQFYKAAAMAHWPPTMNKGSEVIQRLSSLATQQDSMAPQPEFAQTYLLLGQQYQAAGQADKAVQTWQIGASKFPTSLGLSQALAHAAAP